MENEKIFKELKEIMAKLLKRSYDEIDKKARIDSKLRDDLGIDSLESLDFLSAIEKGFSVEVKDSEIMELQTVADVISLIREKSTA